MFRWFTACTVIIVGLLACVAFSGEQHKGGGYKNYEIIIDGKSYDLNLDEKIQIEYPGGKTATAVLRKKPYTEYSDQFVTFQHKSELGVSSQDLGNGITQLMSTTATGTIVMIQEYSSMNPTMLIGLMIQELTKESIDYGYKMTQEQVIRKLSSGLILKGTKATLRLKNEEIRLEVLSHGKKDTGILVITQIDKEFAETDLPFHQHFWKTLMVNF